MVFVVGALVVLAAGLAYRQCGRTVDRAPEDAATIAITKTRLRLRDLQHQPAGTISGRVTVSGKPASALVCASSIDGSDDPRCAMAIDGAYQLTDVRAGGYVVWASAPGFVGRRWRDRAGNDRVSLAAGASRSEIDFALDARGAQLVGTVRDTRGRAVAGALVHVRVDRTPMFTARSDAAGAFTAWVTGATASLTASAASATASVTASADGYVDASIETTMPRSDLELVMLPEATLSGTVVEASTRAPVADATVWIDGSNVITDNDGTFRATKLRPGRYKPTVRSIGGYGEAAESVVLRVGASIAGIVIEVHPVAVVAGKIVIAGTTKGCPEGEGNVAIERRGSRDYAFGRTIGDGDVLLEGVVAGSYAVQLHCAGYLSAVSYPDLVVGSTDVEDVVWTVTPGAKVIGRVTAKSGQPIGDAQVTISAGFRGQDGGARTEADGTFEVIGISAGEVSVYAAQTGYVSSNSVRVLAAIGTPVRVELVLEKAGEITGTVLDRAGAPVADLKVEARRDDATSGPGGTTDLRGEFSIAGLEPGAYTVVAESKWDLGSTSRAIGAPVRTTVTGGVTARVALVVDPDVGDLAGVVVDASGAPVADVAIDVALSSTDLEPRRRDWERNLAWSATDGSFRIAKLPQHELAVRARIEGANEAVVDRVKLGDRVRLVLKPTGVLAGVVTDPGGAPVDDVSLEIDDRAQNISRTERLFHTGGKFTFRELPAGTYRITADEDRQTSISVPLADGAHRLDLELALRPRHAIKGRLVSADRKPLAGWQLEVPHKTAPDSAGGRSVIIFEVEHAVTDARGEFLIQGLVGAEVTISAGDLASGAEMTEVKTVQLTGRSPIDLGELVVPAKPPP